MKSFQGGVLFVDMLGFSALTRGNLKLGAEECEPWEVDTAGDFAHQLLAAKILLAFRRVLSQTRKTFDVVKVAQLSDCAFLWSTDIGAIVDAGRHLMHEAALTGLLCRGGFAFGDVHEPSKVNQSLGAFIVGDAVTRAATYESVGKGMRVFTDSETAHRIKKVRPNEDFQPLVNPLTGDAVDEWRWYTPSQPLSAARNAVSFRKELSRLVGCHTMLRYSPKLAWSATTLEGRRQIACSIVSISEVMEQISGNSGAYRFSVESLLTTNQRRSDEIREKNQQKFMDELLPAVQTKRRRQKS
jgi:hypothetical protein